MPELYVVVPPGVEEEAADELDELGHRSEISRGGLTLTGDLSDVMAIHLHARLPTRVLIRLGHARVGSLAALAEGVRALGWRRYLHPKQAFDVHVTVHNAPQRRRDVLSRKISLAISDALKRVRGAGRAPTARGGVWVRIDGDRATLSIDATGEPMHRRGWGQHKTDAPIRETLAAAALRASGWVPGQTLLDPMCGSGTFLIEAATLVAGKAPGAGRSFAFEAFPDHDPAAWAALRARGAERFDPSRFIGRDIDPRAIDAAAHNARRAGVSLDLAVADVADLTPPEGPAGVILTNPPYGRRLARGEAKRLAVTLGATLRARFAGWGVAVVAPAGLANATGLPLRKALAFDNGGLDVAVMVGALPR